MYVHVENIADLVIVLLLSYSWRLVLKCPFTHYNPVSWFVHNDIISYQYDTKSYVII